MQVPKEQIHKLPPPVIFKNTKGKTYTFEQQWKHCRAKFSDESVSKFYLFYNTICRQLVLDNIFSIMRRSLADELAVRTRRTPEEKKRASVLSSRDIRRTRGPELNLKRNERNARRRQQQWGLACNETAPSVSLNRQSTRIAEPSSLDESSTLLQNNNERAFYMSWPVIYALRNTVTNDNSRNRGVSNVSYGYMSHDKPLRGASSHQDPPSSENVPLNEHLAEGTSSHHEMPSSEKVPIDEHPAETSTSNQDASTTKDSLVDHQPSTIGIVLPPPTRKRRTRIPQNSHLPKYTKHRCNEPESSDRNYRICSSENAFRIYKGHVYDAFGVLKSHPRPLECSLSEIKRRSTTIRDSVVLCSTVD